MRETKAQLCNKNVQLSVLYLRYAFIKGSSVPVIVYGYFRSIANMIDQIRLFQQNQYLYTADTELQQALKTRMSSLITQDLPTLAQHSTNIPKAPSAGKLSLAFKKMSRKMKGGADS